MMLQGGIATDSGDADAPASASAAAAAAELAAAAGGFSEEERSRIEEGGRNSGGNRWPRQETLALLKIRSDMDVVFRDSSLKGPLWDEVSRKLGELGYHRSAKKCKEKFENVYKYHKRTKEGRTSKADGKTYRFFDQLQALETNPAGGGGGTSHHHQPPPPPLSLPPPPLSKPPAMLNTASTQIPAGGTTTTVPSPINITHQNNVDPISVAAPAVPMPINHHQLGGFPFSHPNMSASTNSTSSSTSSDEEPPERRRNRKRKWKDFFGRLMKEVIDKQEELQSKFLETLERRERDRMAREEAWRIQEIAKMKREHDLLVQERSMVAAKDAAVITFLQKITEQNPNAAAIPQISAMQLLQQQQQQIQPPPPSQPMPPMQQQPLPPPQPSQHQVQTMTTVVPVPNVPVSNVPVPTVPVSSPAPAVRNLDNGGGGGGENILQPSPSRWPKAEINALIKLRTTLDTKYQESGPKGPLWEEISSAMRKLGYNRNAKRCKEKWENINKYYKKVKESSKKRPEDSKTCPYFHQLDAIYREKAGSSSGNNPGFTVKPETQMAPIMARPEQQWPLPAAVQPVQPPQQSRTNNESTDQQNADQNEDDYDDDEDDEEEEEEGGEYEIVPNKTSSMAAVE